MWIVQPRQRKATDGTPLGLWHLCCESDEGGGFVPCCAHDHGSADEALSCRDAKIKAGNVTGFPYAPAIIDINGTKHEVDEREITHERICELAGEPVSASVVYSGERKGDCQRSGMTSPGKSVRVESGLRFTCVVTGNA